MTMAEEIVESEVNGVVINSQGAGSKMQIATSTLQSMIPQEEEEISVDEEVETVAPVAGTVLSLADQAKAVVTAVPTVEGFWRDARKKRNVSTLRDLYDLMSGDPELTEDERDGLLTLRKIREQELSQNGQKTLI